MTIATPGRQQWTTSGLLEVTVGRVAAAVHVAMVCFLLVAVVTRHLEEGLGLGTQVALAVGLPGVAVLLAIAAGRGERR